MTMLAGTVRTGSLGTGATGYCPDAREAVGVVEGIAESRFDQRSKLSITDRVEKNLHTLSRRNRSANADRSSLRSERRT